MTEGDSTPRRTALWYCFSCKSVAHPSMQAKAMTANANQTNAAARKSTAVPSVSATDHAARVSAMTPQVTSASFIFMLTRSSSSAAGVK